MFYHIAEGCLIIIRSDFCMSYYTHVVSVSSVWVSLQILLLLGCFLLCWSLYYMLELMLTHVHWHRLRRGAATVKDRQILEMQRLTDLEAKMPLIGNDDT